VLHVSGQSLIEKVKIISILCVSRKKHVVRSSIFNKCMWKTWLKEVTLIFDDVYVWKAIRYFW